MLDSQQPQSSPSGSGEDLKKFQLDTASIKDKSSKEYGQAIARYISAQTNFNTGAYYWSRNARMIKNRNYANGKIDIQAMFQDRFQFNGKTNYIALNWNALQIVNRIISGLISRWMKRSEKIQVKAIDNLSLTDKQKEYERLEFLIDQRQKIEMLQQESGQQLIPQDIPADKEGLNIWRAEMQRLPEEITSEMLCNDILASNGWFDVLKEKVLNDISVTGFGGTYTWMDNQGIVHVRRVKPEDAIYSYTEEDDFRDTSWRGEAPSIKLSELRRQWGKEFNPDNPYALDEKQLWQIAQSMKEYRYYTNIAWNDIYYTSFYRPYDEWNCRSIQFEIKTVDSESFTVTKTKETGSTYIDKGTPKTKSGKPKPPSENQNVIGDTNYNIYRGVYLPDSDILIQWGLKDNMIRPQDPKEIGNAEFSYSFVMPQNYLARNLGIPEKIEAAVDGMILSCLKIQQNIARSIPNGWVIDETALNNIDYGLGADSNKAVDPAKVFFQTGIMYYRGLDAEGNRVPVPITELANSGFANQMAAFVQTYQFWYSSLKDELGEDPNLMTAAVQPRVTAENVEVSQQSSENATDQYYRAFIELMRMQSRKILCLAKDSVIYGASAYRHLVGEDDFDDREFSTEVRFLPTEFDVQRFDAMLNQAIAGNQELLKFADPFQLMRTAREDVKLAEQLFRQAQKKLVMWEEQQQQQNQQATFQAQIASAQAAEQAKGENMIKELQMKGQQSEMTGKVDKEKIALTGTFQLLNTLLAPQKTTGEGGSVSTPSMPANVQQLLDLVIKNIAIPLAVDNAGMTDGIQQNAMQQQVDNAQQEQQMQQPQPQAA